MKPATNATTAVPQALAQFDELPDSSHVRLPVVQGLYAISAATCWRWVKLGRIPAPKRLGPNTTAWNVGELRRARDAQGVAQ